jgi:apolipoprotein N-acyltransferase
MSPVLAAAIRSIKNAAVKMSSILLSILSAILLILSFPQPNFGFLAWIALVPWFFSLRKVRPLQAFLLSYTLGLLFFSGSLYWVTYVSSLGFSILVFYLALYFAFFGLFFSINNKQSTINNLFLIPALWVALEYMRSHLFSGFGWAVLGFSQYQALPVIQISDITGAYGVSFLIVLVNLGIFYSLQKKIFIKKILPFPRLRSGLPSVAVLCPLLAVILVLSYGYIKLNQKLQGEDIKIAVVQGNIPQWQKWDPEARDFILERYIDLTEQAAEDQPDIIIWPETSVPGYLENDRQLLEEVFSLSRRVFPAYLLVGTPHVGSSRLIYNSATLLRGERILQRYDKLHLVPFGEFIPWPEVFSRFSFAGLIGNFTAGEDYTVFNLQQGGASIKLSALICFEDVFAQLARGFRRRGANILVNMTNDAWFGDSAEPEQHLQASVFRAVENRANLVRSANTGVSCFINPWGRIKSRLADEAGRDVLVAGAKSEKLTLYSMPSFYTAFGDIFAWFCVVGTIFSLVRRKSIP